MRRLIRDIVYGDETSAAGELPVMRMVRSEEGLITWATLLAVICFCGLIAIVFNVGRIANDKLEAQNAADSVAYSASLVQARAMNAITTANHMMGELTALYTMHHAIGGKALDERGRYSNWIVVTLNISLRAIHVAAWAAYIWVAPQPAFPFIWVGIPNRPAGYGPAADTPKGEATLYDSKCLLKWKLIEEYIKHIAGTAKIQAGIPLTYSIWPPTVAKGWNWIREGQRMRSEANAEIQALVREYEFINRLESFAMNTRSIKMQIIPRILDALWNYERLIALGVSIRCSNAAQTAAANNMCVGEVLGRPERVGFAVLPIVQDPTTTPERTQLMRATYPWVQEWRWPLLAAFDIVAHRSRCARFYEYHSDRYTKEKCQEFRTRRGYKLYVLEEMNATAGRNRDKGTETWRRRDQSSKADRLFCVVGLARHAESPAMSHLAFLPATNPTPIAAMSQAIFYNGNRPVKWKPKSILDEFVSWRLGRKAQPVSGWDTLNWTEGATEWKEGKDYFKILPLDYHWLLGRVPPPVFDVIWPPDLKLGIPGVVDWGGVPRPKVRLNWQSKLVPIAPRNLALRAPLTRDQQLRERMIKYVGPSLVVQQAFDVIHH
jgi:hypothetical protein